MNILFIESVAFSDIFYFALALFSFGLAKRSHRHALIVRVLIHPLLIYYPLLTHNVVIVFETQMRQIILLDLLIGMVLLNDANILIFERLVDFPRDLLQLLRRHLGKWDISISLHYFFELSLLHIGNFPFNVETLVRHI
jgi:hypothetical protein